MPPVQVLRESVEASDLPRLLRAWLTDGQSAGWSQSNSENYRFIATKLVWWLGMEKHTVCGADELRGFLLYVRTAHALPDGRWGGSVENPDKRWLNSPQRFKAVSPSTVRDYWRNLRAFFNWLIAQSLLDKSPIEKVKEPIQRDDQIRPFTVEEIKALLAATKKSFAPQRDAAIVLFLLDTGCRAGELCALQYGDVCREERRATIRNGKGGKAREIYWSSDTARSLSIYLGADGRIAENPLFASESGTTVGAALTPRGLLKIIARLGEAAGLGGVRCSPHTFRHTFATMYLLAGGDAFSLQQRLGHENPAMTQRYVNFSRADQATQARQFSPVASIKRQK